MLLQTRSGQHVVSETLCGTYIEFVADERLRRLPNIYHDARVWLLNRVRDLVLHCHQTGRLRRCSHEVQIKCRTR